MNPLISVAELAADLAGDQPPVLADVRWTLNGPSGWPEFEAGHIPGANWVDLEAELTDHTAPGGRHPLPDPAIFESAMRWVGINLADPVVVYDGNTSLAAARLWWLLTDSGHQGVRVLDGGFAAWQASGQPVSTGPGTARPAGNFVARPGCRSQLDADAVLALVSTPGGRTLIDVRAADRYAGQNETIDPIAGHIPGAVSRPSTELLNDSGGFLSAAQINSRFSGIAGEPVFYCGSGVTAAHSLLALESIGRTGAIYPGSWSDWITDLDRPRATGPTP